MSRRTKEEKEWFRYLYEIIDSETYTKEEKQEARELLKGVDRRVCNIADSSFMNSSEVL